MGTFFSQKLDSFLSLFGDIYVGCWISCIAMQVSKPAQYRGKPFELRRYRNKWSGTNSPLWDESFPGFLDAINFVLYCGTYFLLCGLSKVDSACCGFEELGILFPVSSINVFTFDVFDNGFCRYCQFYRKMV